ncbi:MAG TPA: hypothetical protein P5080_04525 [Candidatus Paceibacterota bacterium]|nr:hypothetical protein [Candidatus Pacearchaeota archaeon]HRZ51215.1 hypothetical protein [Candidatus Paceibacterota bacterium]HSA36937.1 hypothetical protein [Candidatus Paceibacterota bacterium]
MAEAEQRYNDQTGQTSEDKTGQTRQTSEDKTGQTRQTDLLPSFSQILGSSWQIYRLKIKALIGITLIPVLASLFFVIIALLCVALFSALGVVTGGAYTSIIVVIAIVLGLIAVIALLYLAFWGQIALLYNIGSGEAIGAVESYKKTKGKIWDFAWIACLVGLIELCGYLLLLVPGIIFSIWFSFATIVFLFENEKGMNALLKSREYVRGKWWNVLILLWAMSGLFLLLSWTFSFLGDGLKAANSHEAIQLLFGFVEQTALFILAPLQTVFVYQTFKSLKAVKPEMVFTPSKRTRTAAIITCVLGGLVLVALIALAVIGIAALSQTGIGLEALFNQ